MNLQTAKSAKDAKIRFASLASFAVCFLGVACAHQAAAVTPSAADVQRTSIRVAPEVLVNDEALRSRAPELRAALVKALSDEGFKVSADAPALVASASIDYTPFTALNPANLLVTLRVQSADGVGVDEVSVQRVNESYPESSSSLARELAHALATSPRIAQFAEAHRSGATDR